MNRETRATAVMFVPTHPERFAFAAEEVLRRTELDLVIAVLYPLFLPVFAEPHQRNGDRVELRTMGSVSELVNRVYDERRTHVVVIDDAVVLPPDPFATALRWLDDDVRYSSVSFLSNAADFLSFPTRNLPTDRGPDGHDAQSITRLLRARAPEAEPAPIMYPSGAVVVLSAAALGAVGELVAPVSARFDIAIADFGARARAKGFIDVVDTSTYIERPSDVAVNPIDHTLTPDDRGWLLHRHQPLIAYVDDERRSGDSPFAMAHQVARVKLRGLMILIDGSCFGPNEVGTQTAATHTISSLAAHAEVAEVCVALPGAVPSYAAAALTAPKVRAVAPAGGDLATFGPIDIAYRPYQPVPGWDLQRWRYAGIRLVIGVLDTIAFHNGGYFASTGDWMAYRRSLEDAVRAADAVTVISNDVIGQMRLHRLPFASERVWSVPLGTEHLSGDQPTELPAELAARGFTTGSFALCLGVNYTHKNREIARRAHEILRTRGFDLSLILAGASVPHGTTRVAESRVGPAEDVFVLPEVRSAERNWLLRHASLVWYPTSAEGFGLLPFEAAMFDTPTVAVDFGPVRELSRADHARSVHGEDVPALAKAWTPEALADVGERLLLDADLRRRHIASIKDAATHYSWARTADQLVQHFRALLGQPRR